MIFNRVGAGNEKVTINGEKVTERLDLKEATGIVKGRAVFLTNSKILGHIDDLFYIMQGTALYKGSPYSGWTLEFDFNNISGFDSAKETVSAIEINKNSCIIYFLKIQDSKYSYCSFLTKYEVKNGEATELFKIDVGIARVNLFLLNNTIYAFSADNNATLWKLKGTSTVNTGLMDYNAKSPEASANYNNNRFFIYVNTALGYEDTGMNILKFDGTKFSKQAFNYDFKIYSPKNYKFYEDNKLLATPNRLSFYITDSGKYDLLDSSFKSVDSGVEGGLSFSQIACLYNDNKYRYLLTQSGEKATLEFPVKVYC